MIIPTKMIPTRNAIPVSFLIFKVQEFLIFPYSKIRFGV